MDELDVIRNLEVEIEKLPTGRFREVLTDVNILLHLLLKKPKDIHDLKLHESMPIESTGKDATTYWQVMKVEAGWIYTRWDSEKQDYMLDSSILVRRG